MVRYGFDKKPVVEVEVDRMKEDEVELDLEGMV